MAEIPRDRERAAYIALAKLKPEHRSIIERLVFDKPRELCHHEQEALDEFYAHMRRD